MKIRNGFVSNSSSSSFIVSKDKVDDWDSFIGELETLEEKFEGCWGDNGETFDVQNDYVLVETHYLHGAYEVLKKHVADLESNSMLVEG